jgi:cyclophilin family peptidyl-prolyl cis-trans isomerase
MKSLSIVVALLIAVITADATRAIAADATYRLTAVQNGKTLGVITFKLLPDIAPKHAAFMVARIAEGFYNGSAFHRVIPNFMIQGGDPNSVSGPKNTWGYGGYPEKVPAEFTSTPHVRGIISAARTTDPNSFGGQFFICVATASNLNGKYSVFGQVLSGMEVADIIVNSPRDANDNPINKISMTIVEVPTSVEEGDGEGAQEAVLAVYPQPASTSLTVVCSEPATFTIYDLNGNAMQVLQSNGGTTTLDISPLLCGAYVLETQTRTGTMYRPIMVALP